ncbi:dicarboxylate--CoA ligase PimA [Roseomonas nepalensis]|uniref:Long-chain-fatty-acid--CoA ligase n=1 Tax=Muricoccus nepalensis TaxID=1854500 RepID=A0A502FVG4_9PROT|nr:AMP-binding protein [Roseomonas nepalensis]TPG53380.1 dicarboxylate--CoA ligase PimA [Roseomonas nepalensis]
MAEPAPGAAPRPWLAAYPPGCRWDAPIAVTTLGELLDRAVARWADRPALEYRGRRVSYRDLGLAVDRLAGGLRRLGVAPGLPVGLLLPNTPWHPVCFLALAKLGARVVHLSPLDARRVLHHKLSDSGARLVVTTDLPGLLPTALDLVEAGVADRVLLGEDAAWGGEAGEADPRATSLSSLEAEPPAEWPSVSPSDVALLQYTGGTTGLPKAAMLTHANLTATVDIYRHWQDGSVLAEGEQRVMGVLPLFHIYALSSVLLRHLACGNEILLRPRFDAGTALHDIEARRVTIMPGVPTMWIALLKHPDAPRTDVSSLRACISGGAPLPFEVGAKVEALLGQRLHIGWGMTETSPAGTRVPMAARLRPGIIGVPLPGVDLRVVALDDPSRALAPGEAGEIAIRGPNVFAGYLNQPAETAAAFRDGWFLTGDIGRMEADGTFFLMDRRKNMIISGGFNVYPAAIEGAIYEHPDVNEVVVIGIPDAYRGQSAKAFVTLRDGAPPLTLDVLKSFLRDRLGRHEMPAALELRNELPRSPAGKLLASALVAEEMARSVPTQESPPA